MQDRKRDTHVKSRLLDSVGEWDDLREQHWNMYITICEIDDRSKFDAWNRALKASTLGQPRGMGWGGRLERISGQGTHVHPWLIHVNVWQKPPQYCKVISLQLKKKKSKDNTYVLSLVLHMFTTNPPASYSNMVHFISSFSSRKIRGYFLKIYYS